MVSPQFLFMAENNQSFVVALKRTPESEGRAHLFLEGPDSLNARNQDEIYFKLLRYFDDLDHLKYLNNIIFSPMGLHSEDLPKWKGYVATARRAIQDLRASLGDGDDSLMGLKNIMGNIQSIVGLPSADAISVVRPFHAVVVSAGPSLDLEIDRLRAIQKDVLLIAVDAVLRSLLDQGITPHIVCCTERGVETIPFFENLPADLSTILVGQGTVDPKIFDLYTGPKSVSFKFAPNFLWFPMKRKHHWVGASVAHLCYRMATSMGAQSVALVGQDLAYHPETLQSHAKVKAYPGWSEGDTFENRESEFQASYVEGNWLKEVPSNPMWGSFASQYTEMILDAKVPTFNTSRYGRKILGANPMSFDDWIHRISKTPITMKLSRSNPELAQDRVAVKQKLEEAIQKLSELQLMLRSADRRRGAYSKILDYPHFLELIMEVVIWDYVKAENARWGRGEAGAEDEFLEAVLNRLDPILKILHDAHQQLVSGADFLRRIYPAPIK